MCYNDCIVSFIELNSDVIPDTPPLVKSEKMTRMIVRNVMGKFVWDSCHLFTAHNTRPIRVLKAPKLARSPSKARDDKVAKKGDKLGGLLNYLAESSPEVVSAARKGSNLGLNEASFAAPGPRDPCTSSK